MFLSKAPLELLDKREKFVTRELGEARSYLANVFWPHTLNCPRGQNDINFYHHMAELGKHISLNALSYGCEIINQGKPSDNSYLVIFTLEGRILIEGVDYSIEAGPGMVCVMNPNKKFHSHLSADHKQLTLKVSGALLSECFERLYGHCPSGPIEFFSKPIRMEGEAASLGNMMNTLCTELNKSDSSIMRLPTNLHMECVLAGLLLEDFLHNYSHQIKDCSTLPPPSYIKGAQDYIHAHANENISIQDISEAFNVTTRALQIGFQKYLHVTPIEYLRNIRLDLAHRDLLKGANDGLTVSQIAFDCGFSSSSKFAEYYRARFGCSPSDVLRGHSIYNVAPLGR